MSKHSSNLRLVAEEPYRVFFPLALLVGIIGVLLWPLFYWGQLSYYPTFSHTRLMIEGFVGGFAIGFLGTAIPKMLNTKPFQVWQIGVLLALYLGLCGFHIIGHTRTGDGLFAAMLLTMLVLTLIRVIVGNVVPPPGMVLAAMGMVCALAGSGWLAAFGFTGDLVLTIFSQRLLYQSFILLPLLGIGAYFFPMILGTNNKHGLLSGPKMSRGWKMKAAEAGMIGILIILTYWIEAQMKASGIGNGADKTRLMSLLRFVICAVWITKESGWLLRNNAKGVMTWALRAGIVCLLAGLLLTTIIQQHRIALDHTIYLGGFGLIIMTVATRVIYGHSGQGSKFQKWFKPLIWCTGLLLLGMATRVTADFMPHIMITHHIYAAGCWIVVSIIWAIAVLPSVKKTPFPSFVRPKVVTKKLSVMDINFRK